MRDIVAMAMCLPSLSLIYWPDNFLKINFVEISLILQKLYSFNYTVVKTMASDFLLDQDTLICE